MLGLFSRSPRKRNAKVETLRSMNAADLADIGIKAGDISRLEREMTSRPA
jgi:uncharacterized protein YjiS (DUF1127 family)